MSEYDDLLKGVYSGEFDTPDEQAQKPKPAKGNALTPPDEGVTFGMAARDTALFIPRGIEGAVRSTYGLLDTLTLDALPDYKENFLGRSETIVGGLAEGIVQFGAGFAALGGALGAVAKGVKGAEFLLGAEGGLSAAGNIVAGAATQFTVFDGQSGRLADLVARIPGLEEPMNRYLSFTLTKEEDGELLGRMKNALEGAGVGAAFDGIFKGVRWLKKVKEAEAAGKTVPEAVEHANRSVGSLESVQNDLAQLDDLRDSPNPFTQEKVNEALSQSRTVGRAFFNSDATPDPAQGARFVPLAEAAEGQAPTAFLSKYRTLLDNPQSTVEFNADGTVRVGVTLNAEQAAMPEIAERLNALRESETPGGLGRKASAVLSEPMPGVVKNLPKEEAAPNLGLFTQIGFSEAHAASTLKNLGIEFAKREGADAGWNIKINAPVEGVSDVPLLFPVKAGENPRAMSALERTERAIDLKDVNLDTTVGLGVEKVLRVAETMTKAAFLHDFPEAGGQKITEFLKATDAQRARLNGSAETLPELSMMAQQGGKAHAQNIMQAAFAERAYMITASALAEQNKARALQLFAELEKGPAAKISNIERAIYVEHLGSIGDLVIASRAIRNAWGKAGRFMQETISDLPKTPKRATAMEMRADPDVVNKIIRDAGGVEAIDAMVRNMARLGTDRSIESISAMLKVAETAKATRIFAATLEGWFGALLSSFRTLDMNAAGNLFGALYQPLERAISAKVAQQFASTPAQAQELQRAFQVSVGTYADMWASMSEALHIGKQSFKLNRRITDPMSGPLEGTQRRAFSAESIGADPGKGVFGKLGAVDPNSAVGQTINATGYMLNLPLRVLRGTDDGVKQLVARGYARSYIRQQLIAEGKTAPNMLQKAVEAKLDKVIVDGQILSVRAARTRFEQQALTEGYDGFHALQRSENLLAEYLQSPEWQEFSPIANQARTLSREATYTTEQRAYDASTGKAIPSVTADFADLIGRHPGMKFVSPFVNTPMNLAKFGAQRFDAISAARWYTTKIFGGDTSAYAASRMRFLRDMASGDPMVQAAAQGRIIMGATFATGISAAALAGTITGHGPADPTERKALIDAGWLPYSIKIGDTYVSYARMDPVASMIGTVADIVNMTAYAPEDKQGDIEEISKGVIVAIQGNFANKTYLQGIENFVALLSEGSSAASRTVRSFVSSFVPNIVKDAATTYDDLAGGDPALRDVRSAMDAVRAKIPGLSNNLEPVRNALGEKVTRQTSLGSNASALANLFVPFASSEAKGGVDEAIAAKGLGFARPPSKRNGYDLTDIIGSDGRTAYDRWQDTTSKARIGGMTLRQSLDQLIKSPRYQQLSPYDTSDQPSPRKNAIQTVISRYRRAAMDQTMREMPALSAAERNFLLTRRSLRAGSDPRQF